MPYFFIIHHIFNYYLQHTILGSLAKALDSISERLQRELPGLRGFSSGNLKKMRIFYEEWQCLSIGSPLANQLQQLENKIEEGVEIGEKTLLCILTDL